MMRKHSILFYLKQIRTESPQQQLNQQKHTHTHKKERWINGFECSLSFCIIQTKWYLFELWRFFFPFGLRCFGFWRKKNKKKKPKMDGNIKAIEKHLFCWNANYYRFRIMWIKWISIFCIFCIGAHQIEFRCEMSKCNVQNIFYMIYLNHWHKSQ